MVLEMVYRRKRKSIRRKFGRKRKGTFRYTSVMGNKRSRMRQSRVGASRDIHKFKRWISVPQDKDVNTLADGLSLYFQFNQLVNYTEFTALYDQYRIEKVLIKLHLITNPDAVVPPVTIPVTTQNVTNWYPRLWYSPDYDDKQVDAISDFKQRATTKTLILKPNRDYTFWCKPACQVEAYRDSAGTVGYCPSFNKWINMADTAVEHYGWKWALDCEGLNPEDTQPYKIRLNVCYFFTCRGTR